MDKESLQHDILNMVKDILDYPPQICKHFVALKFMTILEKTKYPINEELVKKIASADDENALILINQELKKH